MNKMGQKATLSGKLPARLANAVSSAVAEAMRDGMEPDEAACVVVSVAADYGRGYYGPAYLESLAKTILTRADEPEPAFAPIARKEGDPS